MNTSASSTVLTCMDVSWLCGPQFQAEAKRLRLDAEQAAVTSRLPDSVDQAAISTLIAQITLEAWSS